MDSKNFSYFNAESGGSPIYLDHNATTPLAARVGELLPEWAALWGNPSSIHWAGRGPKALLRDSRRQISELIHCDPLEIVFTSGGSEANNLAFRSLISHFGKQARILVSEIEHPSVLKTVEHFQKQGLQVRFIKVNREGQLDLGVFERQLEEFHPHFVSMMFANNETGHVFPIKKMVKMAHKAGALFHSDMVQALGKTPIDLKALDVDYASFSGHKFYSLKGCGLLYVKRLSPFEPLIYGGAQERRRRAGTENTLAIAALGEMAKCKDEIYDRSLKVRELRDAMEERILAEIPHSHIYGRDRLRLSNTSSVVIEDVDGESLLMNLDIEGFAISTGAACSSGSPEPSPVLRALGLSRREAQSSLRISLGWGTQAEELRAFVDTLKTIVERLRSFSKTGKVSENKAAKDGKDDKRSKQEQGSEGNIEFK